MKGEGEDGRAAPRGMSFDRHPSATWLVDRRSGRILEANAAALAQCGYERAELATLTIAELHLTEEASALLDRLADPKGEPFVTRQRRKDGAIVDVTLRGAALVDGRETLLVTAEPRTEEKLRDDDRRFRALVEEGATGVALYDADGVTVYVNPAVTRILGIPVEEMLAKRSTMHLHPEDAERIRGDYEVLRTPGIKHTFEVRVRHRDGSWRWIESVATNLIESPEVRGIVTNFRDVTDRKRAEEALREMRARLEFLMSATSAVTYTCKIDGDYGATFISDNVTKVLGYEPRDFIENSSFWYDNIHPDDRPTVLEKLADLHVHGRHAHEYRFRAKDGTWRWMQDELSLAYDESGKPTEAVGYWLDITARKQTEEALRRSEANFRALTEQLPVGIVVHRDGRVLYANPAFVKLLGYDSAADLIGRPAIELAHPDVRREVQLRMERTRTLGRASPAETRVLRRDGTEVVCEMEGLLLPYDGSPANVVITHDLTERREMMARLAQSDRMLSVGTLAAGVAHEINNPLAYVVANLELLSDGLPALLGAAQQGGIARRLRASDVAELLRDAREGASRMRAVVNDLRALSRADDARTGPVDLRQVIESSVKLAANEIRHRAQLVLDLGEIPPVLGNESRLGQVVLNVLLNAAQSIADGDAANNEIRVRLAHEGHEVCLELTDTGCGIPPEILGRIFDPFFTTKPIGVGTGLGLSICHGIVRSLGGDIQVESAMGKGSTFRITLPVAQALPKSNVAAAMPTSMRSSRILVIDDEPAIGKALTLLLGAEHEVTVVTRASDALTRIEAGEDYDVVICDLMMPEMSGMDFYSRLSKRAPRFLDRVVFLTGGAFTPSARAFVEIVPAPLLEKPFDLHDLRAAVEKVLSPERRSSPKRAPPD